MARSLPDISQKVVANAQGFINEFQRADNAARRTAANIDREVGQLSKNLSRKFSLSDIGKDVLKGFGLGSGFAVAQQAADALVGYYQQAADAAKAMEESTARQLEHTKKMIALRQTPDQQIATLQKEFDAKARDMADKQAKAEVRTKVVHTMDANYKVTTRVVPKSEEELAELDAAARQASEELGALQLQLDALKKTQADTTAAAEQASALASVAEAGDYASRKLAGLEAAQKAANERWDEGQKLIAAARTPLQVYTDEIARLTKLEDELGLSTEVVAAAMGRAAVEYSKASGEVEDYASRIAAAAERAKEEPKKVANAGEEFRQQMALMWNDVSDRAGQAFADIVLTGENAFGSLVDIVARSVLEIVARLAIINPILNGLFDGMNGFDMLPSFFGGPKASGGAVTAGYAYRVNEDGQEFFRPNVGGTVIPIGAQRRESSGGNTYVIDARGTDESVVQRLQQALQALAGPGVVERRSIAAVGDARRRGLLPG